tara:strand:+ start:2706 stop:3119 length:414 start_codon:yes stop_codon:yes gene_type:complete
MTTINGTKKEFVGLVNGIYALQNVEGKAFAIKASKNLKVLQDNLKDIEVAGQPSAEFLELAKQVNEIAKEDAADSKDRIDALEAENEKLVKERQEQIEALETMLNDEISIKLETISEEELPNAITTAQISSIQKIIK